MKTATQRRNRTPGGRGWTQWRVYHIYRATTDADGNPVRYHVGRSIARSPSSAVEQYHQDFGQRTGYPLQTLSAEEVA